MCSVFCVQKGCQTDDIRDAAIPSVWRRRTFCPGHRCCRPDVSLTSGFDELAERSQVLGRLLELEAKRPSQCDVAIDFLDQHAASPAQG